MLDNRNYRETFKSPFLKDTREDAEKVLEEIRRCHSFEDGWIEHDAYIKQMPNGQFRAVRIHEKIF